MVKKITQHIIRFVQRIVVTVLLTLIYIVGFGITALAIIVFRPRILQKDSKETDSYWHSAERYGSLENSRRQS